METTYTSANAVLSAMIATLGIFAIVIAVAWYILQVIAYWRIFKKAGKPGWHSIIPLLNTWDEVDLSWNRTMAWVMVCLILVSSIVNNVISGQEYPSSFLLAVSWALAIATLVIGIMSQYKLAKAFGKGIGFFLGLVFLNPIFKLILGFGDARYQGRQD